MGIDREGFSQGQKKNWDAIHTEGWFKDKRTGEERKPVPQFLDFLKRYENEIGPRVLDAGCGPGRHTIPLTQRGWEVTGVDISATSLEQAKQRMLVAGIDPNNIHLETSDLNHLGFKDGEFDTVVNLHVLGHVGLWEQGKQAFAEMARVLKPGGLFFFRVRSVSQQRKYVIEYLDDNHDLPKEERGLDYLRENRNGPPRPNHSYSLGELKWLAKQNSLTFVEEPLDERDQKDGQPIPGQWNIVFRKS